jgi:predicted peptidase
VAEGERDMPIKRTIAITGLVLIATFSRPVDSQETGFLDRSVVIEGNDYDYQIYVPRNYQDSEPLPVILFLHGAGERGSDGISQTTVGLPAAIREDANRFPAIVVMPQSPVDGPGWQQLGGSIAMAALDKTVAEFSTDNSRIYLTGLSQGGNGSWYLAYHNPDRFAAVLVVCGFVEELRGAVSGSYYPAIVAAGASDAFQEVSERIAHIPIWIFHGDEDPAVPVEQARGMAAALEGLNANVRYTELPGVGHNAWDDAYRSEEVIEWLFTQRQP